MTVRQYYDDAYCTQFEANVIERLWIDQKPAIILDNTYFYPSSGGQPHDLGTIQGIDVVDVVVCESDQQIVHLLSEDLNDTEVVGIIDWSRRFDHMQQHTGQHILSQAFLRIAEADTVSFHLSHESSTLDLNVSQLSKDKIGEVQLFANRIVWEDRRIRINYVSPAETELLPLRKTPDRFDDKLRLVEIEDFDLSACGGTHVSRTGEIGLIKITKTERRSNGLRIEFRCGQRALQDYDQKSLVVSQLKAELTTAASELPEAVRHLTQEIKSVKRQLKRQNKHLIALESARLYQAGSNLGSLILVKSVFENREAAELRALAKNLMNRESTVAFLGNMGTKSLLVFGAANNVPIEMDVALGQALTELGQATGGGTARYAQGGGAPADENSVAAALDKAEEYIRQKIDEKDYDPR